MTNIMPAMSQATKSVLTEFAFNKTIEWHRSQSTEQKEIFISLAKSKRREFNYRKKEQSKKLLEQKIANRNQAVRKAT
jgi:hypothetical protein